jgi:DNA-directed RNA polymerase beta' subunit
MKSSENIQSCSTVLQPSTALGFRPFEPVLVEGKAIRIHPLVCAAF